MTKRRASNAGFVLVLAAGPFQAIAAEQEQDGQPVRRFRKELIKTGSYVKASEGLEFKVTAERLNHWAATFSRMQENGVKVPVPNGHRFDAESNRGWVADMFVEGEALVGIIDLVGQDAIAMAGRSDVSIYAAPEFIDGHGNRYEWPILHVALCTDPVVPGLGDFVPVAASQSSRAVRVPVLSLAEDSAQDKKPEVRSMDITKIQPAIDACNAIGESIKACVDALTALTKKPMDEGVQQAAIEAASACKAACDDCSKNCTAIAGDGSTSEKPKEGENAAGEQPPAAPAAAAMSHPPMLLSLARKSRTQEIDGLVRDGKINAAVAKDLKAAWCEGDALALSLTDAGCKQFDGLVASLAKNGSVVPFGEKTGGQTVTLSRQTEDQISPEAKREREEMLAETKRLAGMKK